MANTRETSTKEEGKPPGAWQQRETNKTAAAGGRPEGPEVAAEGVVVGGVHRSLHLLAVLSDGRSILHAFVPTEEVLRHRPAQSERAQQQGPLCTTTGPAKLQHKRFVPSISTHTTARIETTSSGSAAQCLSHWAATLLR